MVAECSAEMTAQGGTYMVAYSAVGNRVDFTVSASTTGWVGVGFSDDTMMVW